VGASRVAGSLRALWALAMTGFGFRGSKAKAGHREAAALRSRSDPAT